MPPTQNQCSPKIIYKNWKYLKILKQDKLFIEKLFSAFGRFSTPGLKSLIVCCNNFQYLLVSVKQQGKHFYKFHTFFW